jgi:putative oxidoreductase
MKKAQAASPASFVEWAMQKMQAPLLVIARLLLAYIFIVEGYGKITAYQATAAYMEQFHVSGKLLPLVILTELGCGLGVALGLLTRLAAFGLAGFALLTAIFFHSDFSDADQAINFHKNLAIAGGFLALLAIGPEASASSMHCQKQAAPE